MASVGIPDAQLYAAARTGDAAELDAAVVANEESWPEGRGIQGDLQGPWGTGVAQKGVGDEFPGAASCEFEELLDGVRVAFAQDALVSRGTRVVVAS